MSENGSLCDVETAIEFQNIEKPYAVVFSEVCNENVTVLTDQSSEPEASPRFTASA